MNKYPNFLAPQHNSEMHSIEVARVPSEIPGGSLVTYSKNTELFSGEKRKTPMRQSMREKLRELEAYSLSALPKPEVQGAKSSPCSSFVDSPSRSMCHRIPERTDLGPWRKAQQS